MLGLTALTVALAPVSLRVPSNMLFSLRELVQWLGFATFELFLHLGALLVFSVLVAIRVDTLKMSWWLVFVPLFAADGLSTYFTAIVSIRLYQEGEKRLAVLRLLWVLTVLSLKLVCEVLLCQKLAENEQTPDPLFGLIISPVFILISIFIMSSGGDVGVLRQEESARMPAWKRELLERRKAKGGEATARSGSKSEDEATGTETRHHGASPVTSPVKTKEPWSSSPSPSHTNGRATETDDDDGGGGGGVGGLPESLVLRESLGPLQENPFIKLEKERKKRRERENAARPLQHVLELYGSVPGIRTIRAENIIIIESDPDYFPEGAGLKHGAKPQQNGTVSGYSSLNDLLDRRSSPVTEIRAREVVVYDTALSRSEENLSTLGRPAGDLAELTEGQGRVSRMLQKFDRNYGRLQGKSRSSENLLDLDTGPSRFSPRPKAQPDVVPKYAASPQPSSPVRVSQSQVVAEKVFQNSQSSKTKLHDSPGESASSTPVSGSPQLVSSFRRRFETSGGRSVTVNPREEAERSQAKPVRECEWDGTDGASKAKVPCSTESHHAHAESSPSPVAITELITSPSFEIRPSPRPDLSSLPASDLQARALANLRLQSRNSFTVIPKRPGSAPMPYNSIAPLAPSSPVAPLAPSSPVAPLAPSSPVKSLAPSSPVKSLAPSSPVKSLAPSSPVKSLAPSSPVASLAPSSPVMSLAPSSPVLSVAPSSPVLSPVPTMPTAASPIPLPAALSTEKLAKAPRPLSPAKTELPQPASPRLSLTNLSHNSTTPSPDSPTKSVSLPAPQEAQAPDRLPITNIDDIVVEPLPPFPSPMVQRRKGNTFTVVPKRRSEPQLASTEAQEPASTPQGSPSTPQAPYAQLGTLLKKRYPAVEEIEVIGGYLSLGRSCLSKTGSTGKKHVCWCPGEEYQDNQLCDVIMEEWKRIPVATCAALVNSTPKTVQAMRHAECADPAQSDSIQSSPLQLKISFNESSLQSTFEYPSESSAWDSGEEEEEGGRGGDGGGEEDGGISIERIRIPRPTYTSSPTNHTPNSTDLSNYTPKHSVEFTAWQEHKLDDPAHLGDGSSQQTNMSEEVMLTPADSSSLSDFSSEPALYF
ncbi:hypothetical protein MHYP_G00280930 [Metynnis hypsauchen]